MTLLDRVRNAMRGFLRIEPAKETGITILESLTFESNAAKNRIWYRGNASELAQLYKQMDGVQDSFWAAVPTRGMEIRKIHVGIPALTVDVLASVVIADMYDVKVPEPLTNQWEQILTQNRLKELCQKAAFIL